MMIATMPSNRESPVLEGSKKSSISSVPTEPKLFFIALRCGRLGNRLILFANFIALAAEQGHRVINFAFHSYAEQFETTRRDIYCQYPRPKRRSWIDVVPGVAKALRETRVCYRTVSMASVLNERLGLFGRRAVTLTEPPDVMLVSLESPEVQAQISEARIVFVYGWPFRAPTWVERHAPIIRDYFRPTEELEQASARAVERLREKADVVVGVHIRHGDQAWWRGGRHYFPAARYAAWMREMPEQFQGARVAFLVVSDESRHESEFPGLQVGFGPNSPVGDMYALAKCDYILGALSSFSQWASFYGNKPLYHVDGPEDRIEREKFAVARIGNRP